MAATAIFLLTAFAFEFRFYDFDDYLVMTQGAGGHHAEDQEPISPSEQRLAEEADLKARLAHIEQTLGKETAEYAKHQNLLGLLYVNQGGFWKGQVEFESALAIRDRVLGSEHPDTLVSLNNLAMLFNFQGNYEQARPLLERALAVSEKTLGLEHPDTANSLSNLAILLDSQGDFKEARPLYERALAVTERALGPEHLYTGMCLNNLALFLDSQGEYAEARPLYERSLAIHEKVLGPTHPGTAASLNNLASFLQTLGMYDDARPLYERSLKISEEVLGPSHPDTAGSLNNLAALFTAQKEFEQARPMFERALAIREEVLGPEHPDTAQSLRNLGALLYAQERHQEAHLYFLKSFSRALSHLDRELPSMSESGRLQRLRVSGNPEDFLTNLGRAALPSLKASYSIFQKWKGKATRLQAASVKLGQASETLAIRKKKGQIQEIAEKLSGLILVPQSEQADEHAQGIDTLRKERLQLERELNRELGLDLILANPTLEEVQAGLPPDAVLLDFFVGKEVYAWVLKSSGEPVLVSLGEQAHLFKAQRNCLSVTALRGGSPLRTSGSSPAANYFTLLWEPLQEAVGACATVFICPDGFLCELPFGVLQNEEGGYLLEKHRFVYLSDPTKIAAEWDSGKVDEGSLLAVGNVNYFRRDDVGDLNSSGPKTRTRIGESWSSLPATRGELQSLRDLHDSILEWEIPMTVVEGKAATEERIRAEMPGKRYVHIATHGYFEPDHLPSLLLDAEENQSEAQLGEQIQAVGLLPGLLSGLVFAGVNGDPDPTRDDGYLSAEEIQHLDLSACDLVVLSACETALGSARAGEGLMSLRRSFSVAGADTVISSLWKVDDVATAQLMKYFYTNLWEKSMGRGEALHEAKLRMLRRNRIDNEANGLPSTWGAFVLSGNWK
ncbi:MAG: CHAT domain-containing protein [Planctomycetes bacterium]|nr:CHAT domain-containing protein [Planctomycetota bacterium]